MLLTSGVNFGFGLLLLGVGFGLREVFQQFPIMELVLKVVGGLYLLYLAWKIANSSSMEIGKTDAKPMTFLAASLFQWVNPKAWVMAIYAMTAYTGRPDFTTSVFIVTLAFVVINFPSVSVWCGFGVAMREWLSDPKRLRIFNITMALFLVVSLWPMLK